MTLNRSIELSPGVHRIETVNDDKLHGYHVLDGIDGPILIDSGYINAPSTVYEPFLNDRGLALADVSLLVITHADADHFGGNHEVRNENPQIPICAHIADIPLIESAETILDRRYSQFSEAHGIEYDDELVDTIEGMMGPNEPVSVGLRGGETLQLQNREITILHTPGHTKGHLSLFDREYGVVIGGDAFFGSGLRDVAGQYLQPPPYFLLPAYETTVQQIASLQPKTLSFTHYDLLTGSEIDTFIDETYDFISAFEALTQSIVETAGAITLSEAIDQVIDRRGDFGLNLDLAYPLTAHLDDLVMREVIERIERGGSIEWRPKS